jgi:YidC/Oxa1 family membrane protein insertase
MNFDRNTIIGFVVLALLFFGYFYYNNQEQAKYKLENARKEFVKDSIAKANKPPVDTLAQKKDSATADTQRVVAASGTFKDAIKGTEQLVQTGNELINITFSSKGALVKKVELKNYKGLDSNLLRLASSGFDRISYPVVTGKDQTLQSADFYFNKIDSAKNADGSKTYSFTLTSSDSTNASSIVHKYTVKPNEYMIDFDIEMKGADRLLTQGNLNLSWQYAAAQQETDIDFEKQNTQVGFVENEEFDYYTIGNRSSVDFNKSVSWVGVRQRFFFTIFQAKKNFSSGKLEWTLPSDSSHVLVQSTANMKVQLPVTSNAAAGFSLYYGPSDYHILKKYDQKFEKLVNLGQGMYSFVRPLNRFVILPIFDFFKGLTPGSMGLAIALLTLIIRLLISPLTYTSYLSGAKMKALRPEIARLKEKFGGDQQAMSMEQMKLFREAGVNPLGGCIPALLQIPIFFALFSFFNSEVSLRGAEFLWANDLAAYDDPIKFGFSIPFLGSHLSLFNVTAAATSFLISWYSMSMTPDQSNPMMKYLPYIFPVFLLFFFNKLPSALTWYYTVSNAVTLILQFIIQNYIIDHDKILAKIEENRKKPKAKSKWQERMEQMQEQQKKLKDTQNKNKR